LIPEMRRGILKRAICDLKGSHYLLPSAYNTPYSTTCRKLFSMHTCIQRERVTLAFA